MADGQAKPPRWWPGFRADAPLARDCVGFWPMWEGQAGETYDVANPYATGHHGTLVNGPTWESGPSGPVLDFGGPSSFINVPLPQGLPYPFTLWCQFLPLTAKNRVIISVASSAAVNYHALWVDSTHRLSARSFAGAVRDADISGCFGIEYARTTWRTGTAVFASATSREIFLDADIDSGSDSNSVSVAINRARFGISADSTPFGHFPDQIGAVAIWARAITASERDQLHYDPYALIRPRVRTFSFATGGAPPATNRRRRLLLAG